jgi:sec-independent protein translocase protein TatC
MVASEFFAAAPLEELRRRLIICGGTWLVFFLACYGVAERIFEFVAQPVRAALPEGSSLVFLNATEPFFTYLKIAAFSALLLALPVLFWQLWQFAAPGLFGRKKTLALPFALASSGCFAAGTWFGFLYVFPLIFRFLVAFGTGTGEIEAKLSMGGYLGLSSKLLLAFGLVFELPIVIFFLARLGIVDHRWLARNRKYALLLAFVIGAVLTPPDIISQLSIAGPFMLLYEVGIVVARLFGSSPAAEGPEPKRDR